MRIMAENDSNMEKDILVANVLIDDINTALTDLKKVLTFKEKSISRVDELNQKKQELNEKLAAIQNSLNVQRLYKYELKDALSRLPKLDVKSRAKFIKQFKAIKECRHDLKELRAKTESDIKECERLIERRKAIRVHENLFSYTLTLVNNLYNRVNEYRQFRNDFYQTHGLSLPSINLSDLITRTNGKEIELIDFKLPTITFIPFIDEEYDTILSDEYEIYEL